MSEPASVGVAMIVKDAEHTLGACLDSIRPHVRQIVVAVDNATTDKTAEVAKEHGADDVVHVQVSFPHECEQHGALLAQHFSQARNQSFVHLDRGLDWWMWIDSDDVLEGGERLADVLAGVPEDCTGAMLPYVYASGENYRTISTVFDRERLLRTRYRGRPLSWVWEHRVHEVVKPVGFEPAWWRSDKVRVLHQEGVHRSHNSAARNLLLLEIDVEEEGLTPRSVFYIGNSYFALDDMARAAAWYERMGEFPPDNLYEHWQTYCYLAIAYERLGNLDEATRAAFVALDLVPDHPEPYFRLASIYALAGEWAKTIKWDREARTKRPPPPFVFHNPLDYSYNSRLALAEAYSRLGHVVEARELLEQADAVIPAEHLKERIASYLRMEADVKVAQAFVDLATGMPDDEIVRLYRRLPDGVKAFGRTRDTAVPAMLRIRNARDAA